MKFFFNSSRNATLSNDLSLRMSIVFGSFFTFGILVLLSINKGKFMVTDTTSDHLAFGHILVYLCEVILVGSAMTKVR